MSELAAVLLKLKLVNREQIEEAADAQILNGGRLGTNLVELGHLSEQQLAEALQTLHRLPALHGEIEPHANALLLIKPEWCDKHNLVPLRVEGNKLYIGLLQPYSPEQLKLLGDRLALEVQQIIIPEFRMNQLLRKYAKAFRPVRPIDLTHAAQKAKADAEAEAQKPPDELMSEDEFQQLYAQALSGGRHTDLDQAHAEHAATDHTAPSHEDHPDSPLRGMAPVKPPMTLQPSPALPASRPAEKSGPARMEPLSFAEAQSMLAQIHDREGIAHVVMRFAASKFTRAVLFTIHGEVATGWEGVGDGLAGNRARRVAIPISPEGTLKLVRESRSHFIGPLKRDAAIEGFFKLIGGAPKTSLVMPILARGRVVNFVYADNGANQPTTPDISELLILTQRVGRAYEEFLARKKAQTLSLAQP